MSTKLKILEFIKGRERVRLQDIRHEFDISRVMIHKYLKVLLAEKLIYKIGKSPIVFYTTQKSNIPMIDQIIEGVKKYDPQKIILFGSHAYGVPGKDSDYDIAVIKNTNKPYRQRLIDIRKIVRTTTPIDFFVFNQDEIDKYINTNPMIHEIMTKGKVIYE